MIADKLSDRVLPITQGRCHEKWNKIREFGPPHPYLAHIGVPKRIAGFDNFDF